MSNKKNDKKIEVVVSQWFELLLTHIDYKKINKPKKDAYLQQEEVQSQK